MESCSSLITEAPSAKESDFFPSSLIFMDFRPRKTFIRTCDVFSVSQLHCHLVAGFQFHFLTWFKTLEFQGPVCGSCCYQLMIRMFLSVVYLPNVGWQESDETDSLELIVKQKVLVFCFSKAFDGTGSRAQWRPGRTLVNPTFLKPEP